MDNCVYIVASQEPVPFIKDKVAKIGKEHNLSFDWITDRDYHYSFILSCNITRTDKEIGASYVLTESNYKAQPVNSLLYFAKNKLIEAVIYLLTIYSLLEKGPRNILFYKYESKDTVVAQIEIEKWIETVNKLRKF